jgi:hypothetical protein
MSEIVFSASRNIPEAAPDPQLLEVSAALVDLSFSLNGDGGVDDENAITQTLNAVDIWGRLEEHASNIAGVRDVIGSLEAMEDVAGGEESWTIKVLQQTDNRRLDATLRKLLRADDSALLATFERAVGQEPLSMTQEMPLITFIDRIVRAKYGHMWEWGARTDKESLPPFLQRLTERPYFARVCLEAARNQLETRSLDEQIKLRTARDAERSILKSLGLNEQYSREYRLAIEARTMKQVGDFGQVRRMTDGGGIESEKWYTAMRWYLDAFNYLGAKRVKTLHDDWGIINLDRYGPLQLERMCRLSEGDPVLLEKLLNNDVTMVATDRFGDQLDTGAEDIAAFEDNEDTTLFTEIGHPVGVYRPFVTLTNRFGVKPSTIIISNHGVEGSCYFGIGEKRAGLGFFFDFGVTNFEDPADRWDTDTFFDVYDTNVRQFFHDFMMPSRATGLRRVLLLACHQAQNISERSISNVEALAGIADPADNVVVVGSQHMIGWRHGERELWEYPFDRPAFLLAFRRLSAAAMSSTVEQLRRAA